MRDRSWKSRLVAVAACSTLVAGMLVVVHEAKSSLRSFVGTNADFNHPYRHNRPIHLRISGSSDFTKDSKPKTVIFTDINGQPMNWKVLNFQVSNDFKSMLLLLEPKDPRAPKNEGGGGFTAAATGTGTIIVTTMNPTTDPETTTPDPGIPVGPIDTGECP